MTTRSVAGQDLVECLSLNLKGIGDHLSGRERALDVWHEFMTTRAFASCVVESAEPIQGSRLVAFGASVLISSEFSESEKDNPEPGLNGRIVASVGTPKSVLLSEREIAVANTVRGVDVAVLFGRIRRSVLAPEQIAEADLRMAERFFHVHRGYRLRRLLLELTDQEDIDHAAALASWRVISRYEEFHARHPENGWNRDRALALIEQEEAHKVTASIASKVFLHQEPILQLAPAERELLLLALDGATDPEIARKLFISKSAVKNRWLVIYKAMANRGVMPELWERPDDADGRGKQKRHRVIEYFRSHPEELRPVLASKDQ